MTEYESDKEADAVVLYHKTDVYYELINGDFVVSYRINGRLKVLKTEGKRVADRTIVYYDNEMRNGSREVVTGLKATAYNLENGKLTKTKMEHSMIHEERFDKYQKVLKYSVPQVKVGTVIEYEYRIQSDYYGDIRDWYAQQDIPVLYTIYELSIPEWFRFNIEETGMNRLEKKETNNPMTLFFGGGTVNITANIRTFIGTNLPALKEDEFVWHVEDYGNKVTAELAGIYIPGAVYKNYSSSWNDIEQQLMNDDDFGGRLKKSSPLKSEIIAAGIPKIDNPTERIAAVWNMLKNKVRWNGNYAFWGNSSSKILKEGTGTNADINFLFINMLHDAGIESTPILIRTRNRGFLPLSHASIKYLNTFVVGIQTTDSTMTYFDSSAEDGYLNVLPAMLLVERGRGMGKNSEGFWANLQETAHSREATTIQAVLGVDGLLRGRKNSLLSDEAAAAIRRTWREAKDSTEQIQKMQERDNIEIQNYQTHGLHDFTPQVKEEIDFTKQCDKAGDIIYLNPLILVPLRESPFTASERNLPIEFPYKRAEILNAILQLPDGYVAEDVPQPLTVKLDGAMVRMACVYNTEDNILNVQYRMNIDKTFFASTAYQDLKTFFDHVAKRNKNIVTIKKAS